jgi:hypothetical protein
MRLPRVSYGAVYQTKLVDRLIDHVKARNVEAAWTVVEEAIVLADSLECPWCDHIGLHEACWATGADGSA